MEADDTNKDGGLDQDELLELVAGGLCPSAAAALAGRFGAADADGSGGLDPAEFHAALAAAGVSAEERFGTIGSGSSGSACAAPATGCWCRTGRRDSSRARASA